MRILFLNLPYKFDISRASRWPEKTKSGTMYYPYWICYAAGLCMEKGHEVDLVDCIAKKMTQEQTAEYVKKVNPDYVMGELTTPTYFYDLETIKLIKKINPSVKILVGGVHATIMSEQTFEQCPQIDIILRHEYDFTIVDILSGMKISDIEGISYRSSNGIIHNKNRVYKFDLDELPMVSKVYEKFLNVHDYGYSLAESPMVQIFSARGCPFHCNFCAYPHSMSGRGFRRRSVNNFVDELEYINVHMPYIKEIFVEDDTFTVDKKRVQDICKEILRRNLNIKWSCNTRVDTLDYETMSLMKKAGCRLLVVGFESGNQKVLDEAHKGITLKSSEEFSLNAKKLRIKVFGCFMIGLKGDSLETIEETFRFAKKISPDMVFFQQAVPFPGTEFYSWVKQQGYLITEDYSKWLNDEGYLNCLVDYPYANHKEIEQIRDKLMSRYYFSLSYIVRTLVGNTSRDEFIRVAKAAFSYILFRIKKGILQK